MLYTEELGTAHRMKHVFYA